MQRSDESSRIRKPYEGRKQFELKRSRGRGLVAAVGALLLVGAVAAYAGEEQARLQRQVGQFSLPFIANQGQATKDVAFYAPSLGGGTVVVTTAGTVVYELPAGEEPHLRTGVTPTSLQEDKQRPQTGVILSEELIGGHSAPITGEALAVTRVTTLRGQDPAHWQKGLPTYQRVSLGEVYDGVEVKLATRGASVEKLFFVTAGAKPEQIRLRVRGGKTVKVTGQEELEIQTTQGPVHFSKPVAYQEGEDGKRTFVDVAYSVTGEEYTFKLGPYDHTKALVIDPVLTLFFLKSGNTNDKVTCLALNSEGQIYVAGETRSPNFPGIGPQSADSTLELVTFPDGTSNFDIEGVIVKLDANLTTILAATFLGGSRGDHITALALHPDGTVVVAGGTTSPDFPGIGPRSADRTYEGFIEGFVAKLDPDLTTILAASYVGGRDQDWVGALALDRQGQVYVAGWTYSDDLPGIGPQSANGTFTHRSTYDLADGFIAALDADLTTVLAATYVGTYEYDFISALAVDPQGAVYAAGYIGSWDWLLWGGLFPSDFDWITDGGFIAKFDPQLTTVLAGRFLGSRYDPFESVRALAVDGQGHVYVAGTTGRPLPGVGSDAADPEPNFGAEGFITKLAADLRTIVATTYLGGSDTDYVQSLALDGQGQVYAAGRTDSHDFPGLGTHIIAAFDDRAGFLVKLDADLTTILAGTLLDDVVNIPALAVDGAGQVVAAGQTLDSSLPETPDVSLNFIATLRLEDSLPIPPTLGFTLPVAGRVVVELLSTNAPFGYTLSVASPLATVGIGQSGCGVAPAAGLSGIPLLSGQASQPGCRLLLDPNPATPKTEQFAPGVTLEFTLCVQATATSTCTALWSSDPAKNVDGQAHLRITPLYPDFFPGQIFQLGWETEGGGGDQDFRDVVIVVRLVGGSNYPVELDHDKDGLWDDWEMAGIDTNGDGQVDLDLPSLGADPYSPDIFLRLDYMDCTVTGSDCPKGDTHSHRPKDVAIEAVTNALAGFALGFPLHLHIEVGSAIPHQQFLAFTSGGTTDFGALKARYFGGRDSPLDFVYHYGIFAHQLLGKGSASGIADVFGQDLVVSLGAFNTKPRKLRTIDLDKDGLNDKRVGTVQQQAGTLMHELGHNLGLQHGGGDEVQYKPNYASVMNYAFQLGGIPPVDQTTAPFTMAPAVWEFFQAGIAQGLFTGVLAYSDGTTADLDEADLNETSGLCFDANNIKKTCHAIWASDPPSEGACLDAYQVIAAQCLPDFYLRYRCAGQAITNGSEETRVSGVGAIDWNCNGKATNSAVVGDINGDQRVALLTDYSDWANLQLAFQAAPGFGDGQHSSGAALGELDLPQLKTRLVSAKDSMLRQDAPNTNEGANPRLVVNSTTRTLVSFDLSPLPSTGVAKATLILTVAGPAHGWAAAGGLVHARRLKNSFLEGNGVDWQVGPAARSAGSGPGVTWWCAVDPEVGNDETDCTDNWHGGRVVKDAAPASVLHTNALGAGDEVAWDVTEDVQAMLEAGSKEVGWRLSPAEKDSGEVVYYSKEGAEATFGDLTGAPQLLVSFE
jgi:beta-propeller repeat-containing protein